MVDCSLLNLPVAWENVVQWNLLKLCGKGLKASLEKLCLGGLYLPFVEANKCFTSWQQPENRGGNS
jgi:hypothetical protein